MDTNVLLRIVLQDDAQQNVSSSLWLQSLTPREPGFISLIVLCEFAWVLSTTYRYPRADIITSISNILGLSVVTVEQAGLVRTALEHYRVSSAGFADCCIAAIGKQAGCSRTVTFDAQASKLPGMQLLK